jgi:transcriptional regulator with GAF, ATPase, and Fis domain
MNESGSKQKGRCIPFEVKSLRPGPRGEPSPENNSLSARLDDLQRLISECTAPFMKISIEQMDSEIRVSIRRIVEFLALDRGLLCLFTDGGKRMICTHYYDTLGNRLADTSRDTSCTPWFLQKLFNNECVVISHVADLPEEAKKDSEYFREKGIQSRLSIPLVTDGEVMGSLSLENTRVEIAWPEALVKTLKPLAEVLAVAVERKKVKLELLERVRFEILVSDISARFVKAEPADVDREINAALERIADYFSCAQCGVLSVRSDVGEVRVTHAWYAEDQSTESSNVNLAPMFPWAYDKIVAQGQYICITSLADLPPEAEKDRQSWIAHGVTSVLNIPLFKRNVVDNMFVIQNMRHEYLWEGCIQRLRLLGEIFVNALIRKDSYEKLRRSKEEVQALKDKLQVEAEFLRSEIRFCQNREEIIGQSEALSKVLTQVEQVAPTDTTVLICGETGTGKELIAQAIHDMSIYRDKVMVKVNCASLPATLVESELFGREKGAYTGAMTRQVGRFEMADGSTIFLDEIAELPLELQAKLLRVLQENTFERLGSPKTIKVNVRVIAATNRNIIEAVKAGIFREDLFYRLNVFPITVPPLRERAEDIPMLVWAFVNEFCEKMGKQLFRIAKRDMEALQRYSWPGNIRELRNIIEHAVIVSNNGTLQVKLPQGAEKESDWVQTLEEVESRHIMEVLRHTGGRIKGEGGAASILGMIPSTLNSRMKKLGIRTRSEKGEISS